MAGPVVVQRIRRYRTLGNAAGVARFLARKVKQADQGKLDPKALQAISYALQTVLKALAQARDEAMDERMKLIEARLAELRAHRAAQAQLPAAPEITAEEKAEIAKLQAKLEALVHGSVPPVEPEPEPVPVPDPEVVTGSAEADAEAQRDAERQRVQAELEADARSPDQPREPGWLYRGDYRR